MRAQGATREMWHFDEGLVVMQTGPEHVQQLEELQRLVFPTLSPAERFEARHYLKHIELFPEGQLCVVDVQSKPVRVVGMTTTIRLSFDLEHPDHTFAEIIQGGWLTSHDPAGAWLYGADIGTHPDYRRRGIARALYAVRGELVRRLGLAGQLTVGMPTGYGAAKRDEGISAEQYVAEIAAGTRTDPTISAQLAVGFRLGKLIPNYLSDPICDNYGIVLVMPADREVRLS
jgi:GNAT superfamily N-acetyltransferase